MEGLAFFLFIVAAVIALAALLFFSTRQSAQKDTDAAADYAAALNYLVSGDHQMALKKLKDTVRKNTDNLDAYIKIGDLLREDGQIERAIKVHRDLTARTSLTAAEQIQILRSLEEDFEARGSFESALQVIQKIYELRKEDLWALEKELRLCEKSGDWKAAEDVYKKLAKHRGVSENARLASYRVEFGKKLMREGKQKEAREAFREAIKADPTHYAAYAQLSENYLHEDRQQDALEALKKFVQANPDDAVKAFTGMKELLFSIGEFSEIENVYSQVITDSTDNWDAYLALAEIKEKKGDLDRAIELCQQVLQRNPDYHKARASLVRYYHRSGKDHLAVEQALALINAMNQDEELEHQAEPPIK